MGRSLLAWRRGCGPRQAGARSPGVNVCCEGRAAGSGTAVPAVAILDVVAGPVSFGPSCSLRNSYTILAPACARCPIATAACDPNTHVSGCRPPNLRPPPTGAPPRRERVAGADLHLRRRFCAAARQQNQNDAHPECHSQQKAHDLPCFPRLSMAAFGGRLAGRLESAVRGERWFLYKFKANEARIFLKVE